MNDKIKKYDTSFPRRLQPYCSILFLSLFIWAAQFKSTVKSRAVVYFYAIYLLIWSKIL